MIMPGLELASFAKIRRCVRKIRDQAATGSCRVPVLLGFCSFTSNPHVDELANAEHASQRSLTANKLPTIKTHKLNVALFSTLALVTGKEALFNQPPCDVFARWRRCLLAMRSMRCFLCLCTLRGSVVPIPRNCERTVDGSSIAESYFGCHINTSCCKKQSVHEPGRSQSLQGLFEMPPGKFFA